ncbi:MAG: helix-turn-helix transcriptional regulator [Lachnoclostridium sp.]|nr:helix-turn-helix transcriptional regulator [Lachnoclostridium sp.]
MILAEKITRLRKQKGWSQEELAARLNISRQSVSKWESTASIPDLDKIIKLSEIFGVSTDYLLKEEIEEFPASFYYEQESEDESVQNENHMEKKAVRQVSLDEANAYMNLVRGSAWKMAAAVFLCIVSPVLLILLGGMAEYGVISITEDMAGGIGVVILLVMIAGAVSIFISLGMKLEKYDYLEKEEIALQYGVEGIAEKKREEFEPAYKKCIISGVSLCILSVVPLMAAAAFGSPDIIYVYCVGILLALVASGVFLFVWSGMIFGSYQKLLEEGDFTPEKKLESKRNNNLSKAYWCIVTAIYLGISFYTNDWRMTWIIWPCAGVLFAAVCAIAAIVRKE